jgi:hypothetical protein
MIATGQRTRSKSEPAYEPLRSGLLQRKATSPDNGSRVLPVMHDMLRSPGQPLDAKTRALMEPRFGHDYSRERIRSLVRAAELAQLVNGGIGNIR